MIIKMDKKFEDCSVGILGFRGNLLVDSLKKNNIRNYKLLEDESDISNNLDFVFVSGYYKIISDKVIDRVRYGIYCFHESPLPEGRGHAPIQWTILNNRNNLTISMFKIDKGIDTGLISYQYNVSINEMDTYKILESKRQDGIIKCFDMFIKELDSRIITLRKQTGKGSYQKRRTPDDSELNLETSDINNLWKGIRICDNDKFPAFFRIGDKKVVLRYEVVDDNK
ncbi:hypothetical protein CMI49_00965 [Candidatus Pacearchaeota archaeon]|nr:hypothetical protein [Candidatus Pacearchaeota archaeon]